MSTYYSLPICTNFILYIYKWHLLICTITIVLKIDCIEHFKQFQVHFAGSNSHLFTIYYIHVLRRNVEKYVKKFVHKKVHISFQMSYMGIVIKLVSICIIDLIIYALQEKSLTRYRFCHIFGPTISEGAYQHLKWMLNSTILR